LFSRRRGGLVDGAQIDSKTHSCQTSTRQQHKALGARESWSERIFDHHQAEAEL
jgi:hypothetical protein